jgi:hypothetical protein
MTQVIDLDLLSWKEKVINLLYMEDTIKRNSRYSSLSKKELKKINSEISVLWDIVWSEYPRQDTSLKESFEQNFS